MFADKKPVNPTTDTSAPKSPTEALSAAYGAQVAREFTLIESVLSRVAASLAIELCESDLDLFCRNRLAKLSMHAQQRSDEQFERVRLLNMLYEGCLEFLTLAATAFDGNEFVHGEGTITRAQRIIVHLAQTLDHEQGGSISPELLRLYDFSVVHPNEAKEEHSATKVREVHKVMHDIYLGYLELEIKLDVEKMLRGRLSDRSGSGSSSDTHENMH